ncbi:PepSY domain-containing protein [Microbulbifer aggregans]|uniref:PepSY domain-containing protein n=1 Tax=Microbulbifer aggregans TaxID=1769779 RepID=UPI001CFC61A5|nr:PepSY domain-containing protein [Microbulbifer aggregans]
MKLKKQWLQWHNKLGWLALVGIMVWALSGILHPAMAWFGPSAARFFPPSMTLAPEDFAGLPQLLATSEVTAGAKVVKVVPSTQGALLQVTGSDVLPRRYYRLADGVPLADWDMQQARWLAGHYSGRAEAEIGSVRLQTVFDHAYPAVNRLLPVYRVEYAGEDKLTLFLHTETGALASLSDNRKTSMQGLFRQLHTFAWLGGLKYGRVLVVALFMLTLLAFAATGLALVLALRHRRISDGKRRYHRLLGYLLWLPLLGWSASGFYHLMQFSLVEPVQGLRLGQVANSGAYSGEFDWLRELDGRAINNISLVTGPEGTPLYRVGFAADIDSAPRNRNQRFDGRPSEAGALYVDARSGQRLDGHDDRAQALLLAGHFAGQDGGDFSNARLITRYGPDYDFRNKRLPVWRIDAEDENATAIFVDPVTGVLVDQSRNVDRAERLSFSLLHKWNHLTPLTGREVRDSLIVCTLLLLLVTSVLGGVLLARRRQRRSKVAVGSQAPQIA